MTMMTALLARMWALLTGNAIVSVGGSALSWTRDGLVWAVSGLWRSAKAALSAPATYPIIAAVAFAAYLGGHAMGARPAHTLQSSLSKVTLERDKLTVEFREAQRAVSLAEKRAYEAENALERAKDAPPKAADAAPKVARKAAIPKKPLVAEPEPAKFNLSKFLGLQ